MNFYDVIIHTDDPYNFIEKMKIRLMAPTKEYAREQGERISKTVLPLAKTAIEVEFRKEA